MSKAAPSLSMSDLLCRFADHLDSLAGTVMDVEESVGEVVRRLEGTQQDIPLVRLQALDFTRQSLKDCAVLLKQVSSERELQRTRVSDLTRLSAPLKLDHTMSLIRPAAASTDG